jgi:hypothetical protein
MIDAVSSSKEVSMPLAKIHVLEGQYDSDRLDKVSAAIQAALMNTLGVPLEDFYQLIFEFPRARFRHTPSFVNMHYSDDLIILDVTFIEGRPLETRLALLKDINTRVRRGSQDLSGRPHEAASKGHVIIQCGPMGIARRIGVASLSGAAQHVNHSGRCVGRFRLSLHGIHHPSHTHGVHTHGRVADFVFVSRCTHPLIRSLDQNGNGARRHDEGAR